MTVTGTMRLFSSQSWVMPSLVPSSPFTLRSKVMSLTSELDLDVDTGRQVEAHERVDGLRRGVDDVDETLVGAHLEVLAAVLVLVRRADDAVDVLLGRQGHRAGDPRARTGDRVNDLARRGVDHLVVIGLEPDADLLSRHSAQFVLTRRTAKSDVARRATPVALLRRASPTPEVGRVALFRATRDLAGSCWGGTRQSWSCWPSSWRVSWFGADTDRTTRSGEPVQWSSDLGVPRTPATRRSNRTILSETGGPNQIGPGVLRARGAAECEDDPSSRGPATAASARGTPACQISRRPGRSLRVRRRRSTAHARR